MNKTLGNIHLIPMPGLGYSSFGFFLRAGSRVEATDTTGVAHLLEHTLYAMSNNPQLFGFMDVEYICFQSSQQSHKTAQNIEELIALLFNTPLSEKDFLTQRDRLKFEIEFVLGDNVFSQVYDHLFGAASPQSRGWSGRLKDIDEISFEEVCRHHAQYCTVDNLVVIVAGDFDEKTVRASLKKIAGDRRTIFTQTKTTTKKNIVWQSQYNPPLADIDIFFPVGPLTATETFGIESVLHRCLTGHSEALLDKLLYKELGCTYAIDSEIIRWLEGGVCAIGYKTLPEKAEETANSVHAVLSNLAESITPVVFDNARTATMLELSVRSTNPAHCVIDTGPTLLFCDKVHDPSDMLKAVSECTLEAVRSKAKELVELPLHLIQR